MSCSDHNVTSDNVNEQTEKEEVIEIKEEGEVMQTGFTAEVPVSYKKESSQPGSIVRLDYESKDYAGRGTAVSKAAYVYLPYGYDEDDLETRYNVLYLMHGWTGHAGEYFEYGSVRNIIDNMIEKGDIEPMIVVSPSFYNSYSSTDFSSSVRELRAFHEDFENNLMPAVEGRFHTYALSASDEDLKASREHRAFGGFSLGSVTTWQIFTYDTDYVYYFLPMSGSSWFYGGYGDFQTEKNVDYIEELVKENNLSERGYFIYQCVGTSDSVKGQTVNMAQEMLKRDNFTTEHYLFYQRPYGQHDYDSIEEFIYNALPLFFRESGKETAVVYDRNTLINDVMNDSVFQDYGRLIFPTNSWYMSGKTLGEMRLTWYSNIDPDMTVEICNYLRNKADRGDTVFYDIYSDEEKRNDPGKRDTGLFFFKGNEYAPTAIISAGGGFAYVGTMHDSFPHALELSKRGYNAFALIYRPDGQKACEDLARAIAFLHEHEEELGISMDSYSLWGGSAGGRMAAWLSSYGTDYFGEESYPYPAAVIVNYTGLSEVYGNEPPTYSAVGTNDGIASYRTMRNRIQRIKANGTDAEIEIFQGLSHGFGLGKGTIAEGWLDRAVSFWQRNMK